jgi:hypothetical protein
MRYAGLTGSIAPERKERRLAASEIAVMAGALIFSLERLIAQRSMAFEVAATRSR